MKRTTPDTVNSATMLSDAWINAWMKPWTAWQGWSDFWGEQYQAWLDKLAAAPNPWLPALAKDRRNQPASIDFFLPWLPGLQASMASLDSPEQSEALRVMLRAALPWGAAADWLQVGARAAHLGLEQAPQPAAAAASARGEIEVPQALVPAKAMPAQKVEAVPVPVAKKPAASKTAPATKTLPAAPPKQAAGDAGAKTKAKTATKTTAKTKTNSGTEKH